MRKIIISAALAALLCSSMTSCMGQFALIKDLYAWNNQIGNKFVNELVFFAFWVLPVYEVCGLADVIVLNTIEFWSGSNPITASTRTIETENGTYLVECDGNGYNIKNIDADIEYRLNFIEKSQTWELNFNGKEYPLLTFLDDTHVAMPTTDGNWTSVDLSQEGVMAYKAIATGELIASK